MNTPPNGLFSKIFTSFVLCVHGIFDRSHVHKLIYINKIKGLLLLKMNKDKYIICVRLKFMNSNMSDRMFFLCRKSGKLFISNNYKHRELMIFHTYDAKEIYSDLKEYIDKNYVGDENNTFKNEVEISELRICEYIDTINPDDIKIGNFKTVNIIFDKNIINELNGSFDSIIMSRNIKFI